MLNSHLHFICEVSVQIEKHLKRQGLKKKEKGRRGRTKYTKLCTSTKELDLWLKFNVIDVRTC